MKKEGEMSNDRFDDKDEQRVQEILSGNHTMTMLRDIIREDSIHREDAVRLIMQESDKPNDLTYVVRWSDSIASKEDAAKRILKSTDVQLDHLYDIVKHVESLRGEAWEAIKKLDLRDKQLQSLAEDCEPLRDLVSEVLLEHGGADNLSIVLRWGSQLLKEKAAEGILNTNPTEARLLRILQYVGSQEIRGKAQAILEEIKKGKKAKKKQSESLDSSQL